MPRPPLIAVMIALCLSIAAMGNDDPSPAVEEIVDEAVAEVTKHYEEFVKANQRLADLTKKDVEQLAKLLTEDGKTRSAIEALRAIEYIDCDSILIIGFVLDRCPEAASLMDNVWIKARANRQALDNANSQALRNARSALQEFAKQQLKEGKRADATASLQQIETLAIDVIDRAIPRLPTGVDIQDRKQALRVLSRPIYHKGWVPPDWKAAEATAP